MLMVTKLCFDLNFWIACFIWKLCILFVVYTFWTYFYPVFRFLTILKVREKVFLLNWDSLHSRLNSHYEAWSFEKRSIKILNSCEGKEYVKEKVEIYTYFLRPEPFSRFSMVVVLIFLNPYDF